MNVVVYISDALRADHVGCYGARSVNTRTLDELAAGGVRFDQVTTAAPWTAPSMTSIATALYPHRHGVFDWGNALGPSVQTLFGRFREADYDVGTFVFDDAYLFSNVPEAGVQGRSDDLEAVLAWLRDRSRPFLLFVHSWATHMPYNVRHADQKDWKAAKREFIERIRGNRADDLEACREAYRQAVEYQSETLVASLLETLEQLGAGEDTVVAFGADHGESWGERFADKEEVQGVYHLHGANLHDEILQVPLILSAPGRLEPGVVRSQVRTVDLMPTLLELAGLFSAPGVDGESLLPLVRGEEVGDRLAVSVTSDRGVPSQLAVRRPPWKVIRRLASDEEEAYRLDVDPRERENRSAEAPADLRAALDAEAADIELHELTAEEEAVIERRLADLGYL
ncbi:MAG: sulfatase family protein [Gaiellaceae bacterium]